MNVNTETSGNSLVVALDGRVDSSNAAEFNSALESATAGSDLGVVLDCENLQYISSAGLRVILTTAKSLQSSQRKFVICTLSNPIQDIFVISGFDQIINIQGSRAEALATMGA